MVTTNWVEMIGTMITAAINNGHEVTEIHVGQQQYLDMTDGDLSLRFRDDLGPDTLYERPMRLVEMPSYVGVVIR